MRCDHPSCTGNHNDRKWETLCPRTRENKSRRGREDWYRNHQTRLDQAAIYRTTAAYMLAQAKHDAHRRGRR